MGWFLQIDFRLSKIDLEIFRVVVLLEVHGLKQTERTEVLRISLIMIWVGLSAHMPSRQLFPSSHLYFIKDTMVSGIQCTDQKNLENCNLGHTLFLKMHKVTVERNVYFHSKKPHEEVELLPQQGGGGDDMTSLRPATVLFTDLV